MTQLWWLLVVVLALGCQREEPLLHTSLTGRTVPFRTLPGERVRSTEVAPIRTVIVEEADWVTFWATAGTGAPPEVDFSRESVAVVFLGERPNPGYTVRIADVREGRDRIRICVEEGVPEPGKGYAAVVVYPFDMVAFRRSGMPAVFESCSGTR